MKTQVSRLCLMILTFVALLGGGAHASVLWTDTGTIGGNAVSASATFTITGNTLTIQLVNTSPTNSQETPTSTLTGISFLLNGADPVLTPVSAISPNGIFDSSACNGSLCTGSNVNVGGEWGYQHNRNGVEAIGAAGYITTGLSGDAGNFNGPNLNGNGLQGIDFGILSAHHGSLNGGLSGQPLIDDTIILTLTLPSTYSESAIGSVTFLYGTSPDASIPGTDPPPAPAPEPSTLAVFAMAVGMLGMMISIRRRVPIA